MTAPHPSPVFLTPAEVAKMLRCTERTLDNWRDRNFGPPYVRLGPQRHHKVVYDLHAVERWLLPLMRGGEQAPRIVEHSSTDDPAAPSARR